MGGLERRTAILKTLSPGALAQGYPGILTGPYFGFATNLTSVANRAFFARFVPEEDMFVTKISYVVSTLDAGDPTVQVGIYNGTTLARLGASTAASGIVTSTGVKTQAIVTPFLLTAGTVYYGAIVSPGATHVIQARNVNAATVYTIFGATVPNLGAGVMAAAAPLPDPAVISTGNNNECPMLAIRTD